VEKVFGQVKNMTLTFIVVCAQCGGLLLAKAEQKTRTCPYCGSQIILTKAKKVASAENAYEASEKLKKLKNESMQNPKNAGRRLQQ
jgi:DNA-directed RNA polymerase subunit RPC12/RpoP